jgi:hypothetical protein
VTQGGSLTATDGTIGSWTFRGGFMGNTESTSNNGFSLYNNYIYFRDTSARTLATIGSNASAPSLGYVAAVARFENIPTDLSTPTPTCMTITTGNNASSISAGNRGIHLDCYDNSGYGFHIILEHRHFTTTSARNYRATCIRLDSLPHRSSIETLGTVDAKAVYWDNNSKYLFWS